MRLTGTVPAGGWYGGVGARAGGIVATSVRGADDDGDQGRGATVFI